LPATEVGNNNMKAKQLLHVTRRSLLCLSLCALTSQLPRPLMGQSVYATPYTFTTLAGSLGNQGTNDGTGNAALFGRPCGVAVDSAGNVFVADANNNTIRMVTPVGVVTTLAGSSGHNGTNDGTGSEALFNAPTSVAVDNNGNIYVADPDNFTIRKVTSVGTNWVVTTFAGQPSVSGTNDGTGNNALFRYPSSVAVDSNGNVYVTDSYYPGIRQVTPTGVVTTLAGLALYGGTNDGTNSDARFNEPIGIAVDLATNIYVADRFNSNIRKITPNGTNWVVTTLAGMAYVWGANDGMGTAAQFYEPCGVAVDAAGNVYVADTDNQTIRKVTASGVVTTLAGLVALSGGTADGTGTNAEFDQPHGVTVDGVGNLYVADMYNFAIRKGIPGTLIPPPILQSPDLSNGQFGFGITGYPGLAVDVLVSGDLSRWQVAGTFTLDDGTNFYASPTPPQGAQFYRARVR
jgi:hypothetical protein